MSLQRRLPSRSNLILLPQCHRQESRAQAAANPKLIVRGEMPLIRLRLTPDHIFVSRFSDTTANFYLAVKDAYSEPFAYRIDTRGSNA